ncbi:hypothetical protein LINPERPRIM_LOCUS11451, partial [Linum perenne]
ILCSKTSQAVYNKIIIVDGCLNKRQLSSQIQSIEWHEESTYLAETSGRNQDCNFSSFLSDRTSRSNRCAV